MSMGQKGKTALITGASRGIGRAAAALFAENGFDLILTCRHSVGELEELAHGLQSVCGISCRAVRADMGREQDVAELFSGIRQIDVLVNNAGISYIGLLQDMSSQDWERMLCTNLTSVFNCCKLAIPYMLQQKQGKIINISSVWGVVGASCETAYSATKGGINAFTRALAKELAPSNIQVNAVACGAIDTEMNQWMEEDELISLVEGIPSGRLGKAEEVADLVYHLGYKESYLTGQVIGLDGGWI